MTNLTQTINVPDGCNILTKVLPIKCLTEHPHVRIFCAGLDAVIQDKDLTLQDVRVLLGCLSLLDFENILDKSQKDIADHVGVLRPEVSKSLKILITKGWLKVIGKVGRQNVYKISPKLVLKSRAKNHKHLLEDWSDTQDDQEDAVS
jgi:hypothetical protein